MASSNGIGISSDGIVAAKQIRKKRRWRLRRTESCINQAARMHAKYLFSGSLTSPRTSHQSKAWRHDGGAAAASSSIDEIEASAHRKRAMPAARGGGSSALKNGEGKPRSRISLVCHCGILCALRRASSAWRRRLSAAAKNITGASWRIQPSPKGGAKPAPVAVDTISEGGGDGRAGGHLGNVGR